MRWRFSYKKINEEGNYAKGKEIYYYFTEFFVDVHF
jgi:hypothetical protein